MEVIHTLTTAHFEDAMFCLLPPKQLRKTRKKQKTITNRLTKSPIRNVTTNHGGKTPKTKKSKAKQQPLFAIDESWVWLGLRKG
jgi:hypothetical protein